MSADILSERRMFTIEGVGLHWNGTRFTELERELSIKMYSVGVQGL